MRLAAVMTLVVMTAAVDALNGTRLVCRSAACHYQGDVGEHIFKIDGHNGTLWWGWEEALYAKLSCASGMSAADEAVPAFLPPLTGARLRVALEACLVPPDLGRALAALGLPPPARLDLLALPAGALRARHFAALPALQDLRLRAGAGARVELAPDALAALPALVGLRAQDVRVAPAAVPAALHALSLRGAGAEWDVGWDAGWGARHAALRQLTLASPALWSARALEGAAELRELDLSADNLTSWWSLAPPRLERAWLAGVGAAPPWEGARALQSVRAKGAAGAALSLPRRWLAGRTELTELRLTRLGLRSLPPDMLEGCVALLDISLDHNRLTDLPESLVSGLPALETLSAVDNALVSLAWAAHALSLRRLLLDRNPLGDLCAEPAAESSIRALSALREISLRSVGLTHLCIDWRKRLTLLATMYLQDNNITTLEGGELEWVRVRDSARWAGGALPEPAARVALAGNPLRRLRYLREHFLRAADHDPQIERPVVVEVEWRAPCDCDQYWLARALRRGRVARGVALRGVRCEAGGELAARDPDALECVRPCVAACRCASRAGDAGAVRARCSAAPPAGWPERVLLWAEGAALQRVPRLPHARELHLAHNRIRNVTLDDVYDDLQELDVRNNSVEWVSAAAAARLAGGGSALWLSDNAWRCECSRAPALRLLLAHRHQIMDWANVSCEDGTRWETAIARCPMGAEGAWASWASWAAGAAGAAGGALLAVAALYAILLRYGHILKKSLVRGAPAAAAAAATEGEGEEDSAQYKYDVFVSYSHADSAWAEGRVVPALEARGRRVCVHARDWPAGEWIPAQIARSVREARRTLALVSRAYCRSRWTRAELRAALAGSAGGAGGAPRLVVVLLEPAAALAAPGELAAHLAAATYLSREDPAFWDKLHRALPAAAAAAPAPSA